MKIRIRIVDAFTTEPFTGNPAGVVAKADGLTDQQMQSVARELRCSETAFILPPTRPDAGVRVRYFTPTVEVPICGHATIAAFHVMAEEHRFWLDKELTRVTSETGVGVLPVELWAREDRLVRVMTGLDLPSWSPERVDLGALVPLLGLRRGALSRDLPVAVAAAGRRVLVPVRDLDTLADLHPNFDALGRFCARQGVQGVGVFCLATFDPGCNLHSRYFAPAIGINEDPVTGTANGLLGCYLVEQGAVDRTVPVTYLIGEQGNFLGRPGRVQIEVDVDERRVTGVRVGGSAVTVVTGDLIVPDASAA